MAGALQMREFLIQGGGFLRGFNKIWGNIRDPTKAYIAQGVVIPGLRFHVDARPYSFCRIEGWDRKLGDALPWRQYRPLSGSEFQGIHFVKSVHSSVYEKNEDEDVHSNRVPEDIVHPKSQKSWVPHPKTGVFGPPEEQSWVGEDHHHSYEKSGESVLEQQAWFRPLEDVQKQPSN
eukprot:Gb_09553 [translate_table: standard]